MIRVFKQKYLIFSEEVYFAYEFRLSLLNQGEELVNSSYFSLLLNTIVAYNRNFIKLIKQKELEVAVTLIRLQCDNLRVLEAEYLFPNRILRDIDKGEDIGKILRRMKVNGENLSASYLNNKVEEKYNGFLSIYKKYSKYVHPSNDSFIYVLKNEESDKKLINFTSKFYISDMIYINQCILDTLYNIISEKETKLEDPELYRKQLKIINSGIKIHFDKIKKKNQPK